MGLYDRPSMLPLKEQLDFGATILFSLVLGFAYILAARYSLQFYASPATFPLAAAVALTGLVIGGRRLWPAVFIASVLSALMAGAPLWVSLLLGFANVVQAFAGASLLSALRFDPLLRRTRDVFALIFAALAASVVVPSIVYATYSFGASVGAMSAHIDWLEYWVGNAWSLLVISPLLIRWLAKPTFRRTLPQSIETTAALLSLCALSYLFFWTPYIAVGGISLFYVLLIPLFWIALRLGARFVTLAIAILNFFALSGVFFSLSTSPLLGERLLQTQVFLIVVALVYFVVMALDEERRYAVVALREQITNLESALQRISSEDQAKSEFLAVLAHELRNPLAPIVSGLELAKLNDKLAPDVAELVDMMDDRAKLMRRLLDDLLDISRVARQKMTLRKAVVDFRELLARSVRAVNELEIEHTHSYTLSVPPEPVFVDADDTRLGQSVVNVLKNSVKYTPAGGHVDIALSKASGLAILRIKDNGIGISKDMLERIFDPYQQANLERAERGGTGLGIGLWLTRTLVTMHGGSIEAASDGEGKGSEFLIALPLADGAASEAQQAIAAPIKRQKSRRVLVVDDNTHAADGMKKLLERFGHEVAIANSGLEALKQEEEFKPEVILLDIGLPDMDGFDVARILRVAQNYSGKLIALTGYGFDTDKERAFHSGFDAHLTKPVSILEVQNAIS